MEILTNVLSDLWLQFLGSHLRHSPIYLGAMIVIAFVLFKRRGIQGRFTAWLFPRAIYINNSSLLDLKIFVVSRALNIAGFFGMVAVSAQIATGLSAQINSGIAPSEIWHPALITLALVLVSDFATYWVHRVHHEYHWLWPFHSVHHSAETMTPLTVYRKHPLYDLFSKFVHSAFSGILQGLLLGFFIGQIDFLALAGINAGYFLFNILGANFRHSHVWISYGRVLEHVLISPAQHQVHHSVEMKHRNKNFGEIFAIWDWMFGTLYVPKRAEIIQFGISDDHGNPVPQPHNTLTEALLDPFHESWSALRGNMPARTKNTEVAKRS